MNYSISEEIANAVSHGLGALFSVAALTLLVTYAAIYKDAWHVTSFAIYGATLVVLFLASTLYHALQHVPAKKLFKLLDHCAIYLLIAGTYTPLMLVSLKGWLGFTMLALVWLVAIAGIYFKVKFGHKYKALSVASYLIMGGISLTILGPLQQNLPVTGFNLLAIGGLVYALGVIFYLAKKIPFNHAIWHVFVLGGASCHFSMMLFI